MSRTLSILHVVRVILTINVNMPLVLFGFLRNLASHLERFLSNHSYGYAFSNNRPTCFASFPRNSEPLMKYPS
jgi:hypothetical protein